MPGASSQLQAAFVNHKLYAISGFATNRTGIYDPPANSWNTGAPLPVDLRKNFGRAVFMGKIYVIGGDDFFGVNPVNTNYVYDTVADSWARDDNMPTKRSEVVAVNLQGKIYVIGGRDINHVILKKVEIFDPSQPSGSRWTTGTPLPAPRAGAAAGAINGKIYLFGGVDDTGPLISGLVFDPATNHWTPGTPPLPDMPIAGTGRSAVLKGKLFIIGCGVQSKQVEAFDPTSNTWDTTYPDLPTGRNDGGVASDQDSQKIYVAGGGDTNPLDELDILSLAPGPPVITNPTDLDFLSTNEVFDPGNSSNPWASVSRMPTARAAFGIAAADGKIYVGGGTVTNGCSSAIGILEAYDPATDSWATLPPMPTPRSHLAAAAISGVNTKIYFIGGQEGCRLSAAPPTDIVESFDPANNAWETDLTRMLTPRLGARAGVINSKIYVVGGQDKNGMVLPTLEVFDPAANGGVGGWTGLSPMPTARVGPAVAVVNNTLYAIGGSDDLGNSVTVVEAYDPETDSWTAGVPPFPALPTGRNKAAGVGVISNTIYVFGGSGSFKELSINEAFDPATNQWSTAPAMPTARFGLGGAVVRNSVLGRDQLFAVGGHLQGIATVGQEFIYQITATNHPTNYTLDSATPLPAGLKLDIDSGLIFGIPKKKSRNTVVTVTATNPSGFGSASLQFSVQPSPTPGTSAPQIVSHTSATGKIGSMFKFQVLAVNFGSSKKYVAGGLPQGLSIDPTTGRIFGTPTSGGNFAVSLSVEDGATTLNDILQLTIIGASDGPIITSAGKSKLVPGQKFSYTMQADSTDTVFSYIGSDGLKHPPNPVSGDLDGLPTGLSFDPMTHIISGTYTGAVASPVIDWNNAGSPSSTGLTGPPYTITIRPRLSIQTLGTDTSGTGTLPLNFATP